jgi:RNA polymerase sigma-70 factor (ECF subfamily)
MAIDELIESTWDRLHDRLVFYAMGLVRDRRDAEDTVHEVYASLLQREGVDFENEKALTVYLIRSVRNRAIDRLEKKDGLRRATPLSELRAIDMQVREQTIADIDEELLAEIRSRVELLPPQTRRVLEMVMVDGMKYGEAARELGISVNSVKTLLQRATRLLRRHFAGREEAMMLHLLMM